MNPQMVRGILDAVASRQLENRGGAKSFKYRTAVFREVGNYEYTSDWMSLPFGEQLPGLTTLFIKGKIDIPADIDTDGADFRDYLIFGVSQLEGIVKINGEIYHGADNNRSRMPLRKEWAGKTLDIEAELFNRRSGTMCFISGCYIGRINRAVEKYYYDMKLAYDFYLLDEQQKQNENNYLRVSVMNALKESVRYFDSDLTGAAYTDAVKKADVLLCKKLAAIDDGDIRGHISFVGHTHIDTAWLWQIKDTVRKCGHSFANMLRLMDEYPDFTFACSQLQLLEYTKQTFPDLYSQIKERIKEGRWELVGPMWVESDCNVVSGEALVRQFLYGINYMLSEFGTRNSIAWLPDTFGFQPNLPQIMKKTGTDYFYSNKIHWQGQNRFPFASFIWRGIDGSEVTASIPRTSGFYNGNPAPDQMRFAKDMNLQTGTIDDLVLPYGYGDGGGGPVREMVENAKRLADFPGLPKSTVERASDFFDRIEKQKEKLPVWYGDLYIETHRGTLSSEGHNKRNNRMAEIMYQNAEKLAVIASQNGAKPDWASLAEGWKMLLTLQFHDILPGSSIREVYEDSDIMYGEIFNIAKTFTDKIMPSITRKGDGMLVMNTLGWQRSGVAVFEVDASKIGRDTSVLCDGIPVATEIEKTGDRAVVRFAADNIPSYGGKYYELGTAQTALPSVKTVSKRGGYTLDNGRFIIVIDRQGRITRLYDKKRKRETLAAPANDIKLFYDGPQHEDAWNIFPEYREREVAYAWENKVKIKENNAVRTVVSVVKKTDKCVFNQDIVVYPDCARIDFVTHIDWRERHKVMRVYFPTNINAPYAALEVGFGTYMRPSVASTDFERSRFEFCAHKFIDLSEGDYGVSVLNDCKYGHDVNGGTMGITLLRSTTSPDPVADLCEHDITYSIYPHSGDWREAGTARAGHELNNPFVVCAASAPENNPESFVYTDNKNIIIDTVKAAEDGSGTIVRLYESNGNSGRAGIIFNKTPLKAEETDLLEQKTGKAKQSGSKILFDFKPYEIKTFKIGF